MLNTLKRLYRDERGAVGLETLLIVAAVVLPLLGLLVYYRQDIGRWLKNMWEKYRGDAMEDIDTATPTS